MNVMYQRFQNVLPPYWDVWRLSMRLCEATRERIMELDAVGDAVNVNTLVRLMIRACAGDVPEQAPYGGATARCRAEPQQYWRAAVGERVRHSIEVGPRAAGRGSLSVRRFTGAVAVALSVR